MRETFVDCVCGHNVDAHRIFICATCNCLKYDPAGHNAEIVNLLCPSCRKSNMEKGFDTYFCYACNYTIPEDRIHG